MVRRPISENIISCQNHGELIVNNKLKVSPGLFKLFLVVFPKMCFCLGTVLIMPTNKNCSHLHQEVLQVLPHLNEKDFEFFRLNSYEFSRKKIQKFLV